MVHGLVTTKLQTEQQLYFWPVRSISMGRSRKQGKGAYHERQLGTSSRDMHKLAVPASAITNEGASSDEETQNSYS